jgi:hypothetical protein
MNLITEVILPELATTKPPYAQLLRSFLEHKGDIEVAALEVGLSKRQLSRRLQETVFPAVQRIAGRMGLGEPRESAVTQTTM